MVAKRLFRAAHPGGHQFVMAQHDHEIAPVGEQLQLLAPGTCAVPAKFAAITPRSRCPLGAFDRFLVEHVGQQEGQFDDRAALRRGSQWVW